MGVKLDDAIKRAQDRLAKLEERKKQSELKKEDRVKSKDTRRKVLLGAFVLELMKHGDLPKDWKRDEMVRFFTKQADREALGLEPIEQTAPITTAEALMGAIQTQG